MLISVSISAQIGCGNKVLTTPLNRAQFDSSYTYNIHAAQNTELPSVPGASIQNLPDRIHITQNNQTKYLLHNQVHAIDGVSNYQQGSHAIEGMLMGATVLGVATGAATIGFASTDECYDGGDECGFSMFMSGLGGFIVGGIVGGVVGAGIGSMVPKNQKIQIIPYFSPTAQNVSGGANVQVNF